MNSEGFSKTLANFGTKGRGLLVKLINARRLEIIPKTKENHNIERECKPDFKDGVTKQGAMQQYCMKAKRNFCLKPAVQLERQSRRKSWV